MDQYKLIKTIDLIIKELEILNNNISISQGIHSKYGLYRKIGDELFNGRCDSCKMKTQIKFLKRLKYRGNIEPEFSNKQIIDKLKTFKTTIESNHFDDWMDQYAYILGEINYFRKYNDNHLE
jgi:hypothetical protein